MLNRITIDKTVKLVHSEAFVALCEQAASQVQQVSAEALADDWQQHAQFLVDVRDGQELQQQGYIDGATHISKGWLEANIHHLTTDKSASIICYCGSGKRSLLAALNLQKMGYLNVRSLQGGFKGWKAAGLPISDVTSE